MDSDLKWCSSVRIGYMACVRACVRAVNVVFNFFLEN